MKKKKDDEDPYRKIRKPVPPPTRIEPDKREDIKEREDEDLMDRYRGRTPPDD